MSFKRHSLSVIVAVVICSLVFANGCAKKESPAASKPLEMKEAVVKTPSAKEAAPSLPSGEVKRLYGFEKDFEGWAIPEWALEAPDHVARNISVSSDYAKEGKSSLKVDADFPGNMWTAAVVEVMEYFDFGRYREIACDIYLPKEAPPGLRAKIILTVGEGWKFTEMARAAILVPGEWTTVRASILPGSEDWKATVVDDAFRRDVRKIVVRIESNKAVYKGPIYIDNIIVSN